jgi:hypothetical protein
LFFVCFQGNLSENAYDSFFVEIDRQSFEIEICQHFPSFGYCFVSSREIVQKLLIIQFQVVLIIVDVNLSKIT